MKKLVIMFFVFSVFSPFSYGCTSFILKTTDGSPIYGRTLEWGDQKFKSNLTIIPRNHHFVSYLPGKTKGMQWRNKYGYVAMNAKNKSVVADGLNERGLAVGALLFPGFAKYQPFDFDQKKNALNSTDISAYILGNFDNVKQIRSTLKNIQVVYNKDLEEQLNLRDFAHYVVTDADGQSIVIEYVKGKLHIHDNKARVLTNSPAYGWHLLNLRNYPQLQPLDRLTQHKSGINLSPFGRGSGMIGLPGDFSPPSRFVRAFFYTHNSPPLHTHAQAINQAAHILNSFDIPDGSVADGSIAGTAGTSVDYTQWSAIADLKKKVYYYWTEHNRRMRVVNLNKLDFSSETSPREIALDNYQREDIEDVSDRLNRSKKGIMPLVD